MTLALFAVGAAKLYGALGFLFAIWFAWRGAGWLDPVAGRGTIGFRLLIIPGATALWPYLVARLIAGGPTPREQRDAHRLAARMGGRR